MITKIKEYISFGDFNSRDAGWYLQKREAPTPDEKEIVESIPYMQGELDFSSALGERVFESREITYEFNGNSETLTTVDITGWVRLSISK